MKSYDTCLNVQSSINITNQKRLEDDKAKYEDRVGLLRKKKSVTNLFKDLIEIEIKIMYVMYYNYAYDNKT